MNRLCLLFALALLCAAPAGARAGGTSTDILRENARIVESGGPRVANLWWLPPEYWDACAKELGVADEKRVKVRALFRDYIIVGAIDATIQIDRKPDLASIADIVARSKFYRNGEEVEVLREVDKELPETAAQLVYLMRASLGALGDGLRLLPLPNVDAKGDPILTATKPGELHVEFRFEKDGPAKSAYWHAPLTSVAGERTCPKGGEPLEASFDWCPWHGVKVEGR